MIASILLLLLHSGCRSTPSPGIRMEADVSRVVPTLARPIAMNYVRGDVYDLLFGGADVTGRRWVRADENTVAVRAARRYAAVVSRVTRDDQDRVSLTFYNVEGEATGTITLPPIPRYGTLNLWVGDDAAAIVAYVITTAPLRSSPARGSTPWTSRLYHVTDKGTLTTVEDIEGIMHPWAEDVWFASTEAFCVLTRRPATVDQNVPRIMRLRYFVAPDEIAWTKEIATSFARFAVPRQGALCSLFLSQGTIHVLPDGSCSLEEHVHSRAAFEAGNPNYKERAGSGYEKTYLPIALKELQDKVGLTRKEQRFAREALKSFIYEYLDLFVAGGSKGVFKEHPALIDRLDARFAEGLSGDKYQQYLAWRCWATGPRSGLGFLLMRPGLPELQLERLVRDIPE